MTSHCAAKPFSRDALELDVTAATTWICQELRRQVLGVLHRRGIVVAMSGGIDSSVVAALSVRALGPKRVLGLFLPERDSSPDALRLGRMVAEHLGIATCTETLAAGLEALGCYQRQDEAVRAAVPDFGPGDRFKLVLPSILQSERLNLTRLVVQHAQGHTTVNRLPAQAYLQLVAATNYKQRLRKVTEYYHADRLNFAVAGTPNRLEHDQGFFVKLGDGAADVKPIVHLYKTQVYRLAEHLEIPLEVRERPPTTDTFSLPQTQEEFYFSLPYDKMDLCLYAYNHGISAVEAAAVVELEPAQVERVYRDIVRKRKATAYLHAQPLLVEDLPEVSSSARAPENNTRGHEECAASPASSISLNR